MSNDKRKPIVAFVPGTGTGATFLTTSTSTSTAQAALLKVQASSARPAITAAPLRVPVDHLLLLSRPEILGNLLRCRSHVNLANLVSMQLSDSPHNDRQQRPQHQASIAA